MGLQFPIERDPRRPFQYTALGDVLPAGRRATRFRNSVCLHALPHGKRRAICLPQTTPPPRVHAPSHAPRPEPRPLPLSRRTDASGGLLDASSLLDVFPGLGVALGVSAGCVPPAACRGAAGLLGLAGPAAALGLVRAALSSAESRSISAAIAW